MPEAGKDAEKLDHPYTGGWKVKCYSHSGNSLAVSYKTIHAAAIQLSNCTPEHLSHICENARVYKDMYMNVHRGFIHIRQKLETTQKLSAGGWLNGILW